MGGKPKTTTPKDMRLARNNPNAGKAQSKVTKAVTPVVKPKGK